MPPERVWNVSVWHWPLNTHIHGWRMEDGGWMVCYSAQLTGTVFQRIPLKPISSLFGWAKTDDDSRFPNTHTPNRYHRGAWSACQCWGPVNKFMRCSYQPKAIAKQTNYHYSSKIILKQQLESSGHIGEKNRMEQSSYGAPLLSPFPCRFH